MFGRIDCTVVTYVLGAQKMSILDSLGPPGEADKARTAPRVGTA